MYPTSTQSNVPWTYLVKRRSAESHDVVHLVIIVASFVMTLSRSHMAKRAPLENFMIILAV